MRLMASMSLLAPHPIYQLGRTPRRWRPVGRAGGQWGRGLQTATVARIVATVAKLGQAESCRREAVAIARMDESSDSTDGIGEGDFVRRKADGDLRSLERSLAQYCSISIHCSIDMTAARCVMQD